MLLRCLAMLLCGALYGGEVARIEATKLVGGVTTISHGSCFAVGARQVVTAYHNLADIVKRDITVETRAGKVHGRLVHFSEDLDLALVEVAHDLEVLPLASGQAEVIGSEHGRPITSKEGSVYEFFLRTGESSIGISGGPILQDGKVIGMALGVMEVTDYEHGIGRSVRCLGSAVILKQLRIWEGK